MLRTCSDACSFDPLIHGRKRFLFLINYMDTRAVCTKLFQPWLDGIGQPILGCLEDDISGKVVVIFPDILSSCNRCRNCQHHSRFPIAGITLHDGYFSISNV